MNAARATLLALLAGVVGVAFTPLSTSGNDSPIQNGDFESTEIDGWRARDASTWRTNDPGEAHFGSGALRIEAHSDLAEVDYVFDTAAFARFDLTTFVRASEPGWTLSLVFYDGDDGFGHRDEYATGPGIASTEYRETTLTAVAPVGTRSAALVLRAAVEGNVVLVDDVQLAVDLPDVTPTETASPTASPTASHTPTPTSTPGPLGWELLNGGFDDVSGDGVIRYWSAHNSSARSADGVSRMLDLVLDGGTGWASQSLRVDSGGYYRLAGDIVAVDGEAWLRVAWYDSDDASGVQTSVSDSSIRTERGTVDTAAVRAPPTAQSAEVRIMLRTEGLPGRLVADNVTWESTDAPDATPTPTEEPVDAEPDSRLRNGGFEQLDGDGHPANWRPYGGEVTSSGAPANSGISARFTSRSHSTKWLWQTVTVTSGRYYRATGWASVDGDGEAFIRISWYSNRRGTGDAIDTVDSAPVSGAGRLRPLDTVAVGAPQGARSARVRLMLRPASSEPVDAYFDDVTWNPADRPEDTPTASPTGTPEPSESPTPSATEVSPGEALRNASFEREVDGRPANWRKYGGSVASSTGRQTAGTRSALLESASDSTKWIEQVVLVVGGVAYSAGADVALEGHGEGFVRIAWYASDDASGSALGYDDSAVANSGNFVHVRTGSLIAPPAARSASVKLVLRPMSAAPASAYFDAASFRATTASRPTETPTSAPTATATPSPSATHSPTSTPTESAPSVDFDTPEFEGSGLKITEVMIDPAGDDEASKEWVELHNTGTASISTAGWVLADNKGAAFLTSIDVPAGGFVVVVPRDAVPPGTAKALVLAGARIGNGLANGGDRVGLFDPAASLQDVVAWDSGELEAGAEGHSLARIDAERDTNSARDWGENSVPSPGNGAFTSVPVEATATPTAESTATSTATDTSTPVASTPGPGPSTPSADYPDPGSPADVASVATSAGGTPSWPAVVAVGSGGGIILLGAAWLRRRREARALARHRSM